MATARCAPPPLRLPIPTARWQSLPAGTANLFATGLDLPSKPDEIVELILRGDRRTIDTGVCNGLRFAVMGGTGLDAAMIAQADDQKDSLGTWAYVKAGVKEARTRASVEAKISVDGSVLFEGDVTCVLVGNLGRLKGGFIAFPDASPTDGVLDVAVLTATGLREWASVMVSAVRHKQEASSHVHISSGTKIKVTTRQEARLRARRWIEGANAQARLPCRSCVAHRLRARYGELISAGAFVAGSAEDSVGAAAPARATGSPRRCSRPPNRTATSKNQPQPTATPATTSVSQ